jgi:Asp-tRNA(Asn)/Glu-tRNA(Gln) amidotransferase A subunit family amidase
MNGLGFRSMAATNCKNRIPSGVRDRFLRAVGAKESDVATPTGTSDAMHITHGERLVLVKDNICDENIDMRCSSVVLDGYRSSATALALARLRDDAEAPYAVLSEPRANMDEFAMGSLTQNSIYGVKFYSLR